MATLAGGLRDVLTVEHAWNFMSLPPLTEISVRSCSAWDAPRGSPKKYKACTECSLSTLRRQQRSLRLTRACGRQDKHGSVKLSVKLNIACVPAGDSEDFFGFSWSGTGCSSLDCSVHEVWLAVLSAAAFHKTLRRWLFRHEQPAIIQGFLLPSRRRDLEAACQKVSTRVHRASASS